LLVSCPVLTTELAILTNEATKGPPCKQNATGVLLVEMLATGVTFFENGPFLTTQQSAESNLGFLACFLSSASTELAILPNCYAIGPPCEEHWRKVLLVEIVATGVTFLRLGHF
jgi:hypothetical protein